MNDQIGGSEQDAIYSTSLNSENELPNYDDVTLSKGETVGRSGKDPDVRQVNSESPPTYSSLFSRRLQPNSIGRQMRHGVSFHEDDVNESTESDSGPICCYCETCEILGILGFCCIVLVLVLGIPIAMIAIGAINLSECEIKSEIPIWLIVMGVFQLLEGVFRVYYHCSRDDGGNNEGTKDPVALFLLVWFIVGNVWVFRNWDEYTPVKMNGTVINDNYCDQLTMRFSFWMIISYYIIGGVLCWCGCLAVSLVSCLFADG